MVQRRHGMQLRKQMVAAYGVEEIIRQALAEKVDEAIKGVLQYGDSVFVLRAGDLQITAPQGEACYVLCSVFLIVMWCVK